MLEIVGSTVIVNGVPVAVSKKPKYKKGVPKIETRTSLMGNTTVVTQAQDFSEAYSEVTLGFRNTVANVKLLESWQRNIGKNAIRIIDNGTGFVKTFNQMSVSEDVEVDFDSEEFEVVFQGASAQ